VARGDLKCRLDEAALEIERRRLRISTNGEHIKLKLGYPGAEALHRGARELLGISARPAQNP
jgi:hypothetical protein